MFCLSPSTLIINVFSFLIKIALFYWPFIWKHTISQVLSKAAIQSKLLFTKNTKLTTWSWIWGCWRCFRCLRSLRWCRFTNILPVRPRNQQIWFFNQNHKTIKPIENERFLILCPKICTIPLWVYTNFLWSSQMNISYKGLNSIIIDGTDIISLQHRQI